MGSFLRAGDGSYPDGDGVAAGPLIKPDQCGVFLYLDQEMQLEAARYCKRRHEATNKSTPTCPLSSEEESRMVVGDSRLYHRDQTEHRAAQGYRERKGESLHTKNELNRNWNRDFTYMHIIFTIISSVFTMYNLGLSVSTPRRRSP